MRSAKINDYRFALAGLVLFAAACSKGEAPSERTKTPTPNPTAPAEPPAASDREAQPTRADGTTAQRAGRPDAVGAASPSPAAPTIGGAQVRALIADLIRCPWKAPTEDCKAKAKAMLGASRSGDPATRLASLGWLTQPSAADAPGVVKRLLSMLNRDGDERVRRQVCSNMGRLGHPKLLAAAARYTISAHESGLYSACMEGLVALWANPHSPHPPSPDAYRLTLKRLSAIPRRPHQPPASVFHALRRIPVQGPEAPSRHAARWTKRSRSFYRPGDLATATQSVVEDPAVPWQTRLAGIELLVHLRTPKSRLETLAKTLAKEPEAQVRPLLVRLERVDDSQR